MRYIVINVTLYIAILADISVNLNAIESQFAITSETLETLWCLNW